MNKASESTLHSCGFFEFEPIVFVMFQTYFLYIFGVPSTQDVIVTYDGLDWDARTSKCNVILVVTIESWVGGRSENISICHSSEP